MKVVMIDTEMTLEEHVFQLPMGHRARKEYSELMIKASGGSYAEGLRKGLVDGYRDSACLIDLIFNETKKIWRLRKSARIISDIMRMNADMHEKRTTVLPWTP